MSKKLYPETDIQNIANAIRNLNGSSDTYTVSEMASAIELPENGFYLKESTEANPLSITDGEELNAQSCEVSFEPIQDLNGYDSPWIDSDVINKEPYLMRAVSGTATRIGNSLYDTLVGGTVAFNQLVQNGNFADTSHWGTSNGTLTVSGNVGAFSSSSSSNKNLRTENISFIANHIYLLSFEYKSDNNFNFQKIDGSIAIPSSSAFEKISILDKRTTDSQRTLIFYDYSGSESWELQLKNVTTIDLTQMFGSTIADYIYSLEQATAGSGVAYFKSLFPKDYYDYNAGQLMSVKALSHKMVGFNQWDEQWELGGINATTGQNNDESNCIRSKNYIPVFPLKEYYFKAPTTWAGTIVRGRCYDKNKNYLQNLSFTENRTFTIPANCYYFRFVTPSGANVTTYNNDICFNLHWDGERDGEYEAYEEHIYPLDSDLELRGIPKLDSNNKLYYDGDTYESDGTVTRKYAEVDLGDYVWTYDSTYNRFTTSVSIIKESSPRTMQIMCEKYTAIFNGETIANVPDKSIYAGSRQLLIQDSAYTDASAFRTAVIGVKCIIPLKTPTTETADTFTNPQLVDNWGTEEYTDSREVQIPVGHETYQANICEISGWDSLDLYQDTEQTETPETTHTATFGQTYYGGKYDFVSGKLTITHKYIDLGDLNWHYGKWGNSNSFDYTFSNIVSNGNSSLGHIMCSIYKNVTPNRLYSYADDKTMTLNNTVLRIVNNNYTDPATFKTAMSGVQFCYELETPQETTLTPSQIALLENNNVLWSDSNGNVKLKYFSKSLS